MANNSSRIKSTMASTDMMHHPPQPPYSTFSTAASPKRPPLPPNTILQKRPLLHPPIPNPRSKRTQQVIYISARTPFISAVKRVRKILAFQEGSFSAGLDEVHGEQARRVKAFRQHQKRGSRGGGGLMTGGNQRTRGRGGGKTGAGGPAGLGESVTLKATGRAIEKCMSLGMYFMKDSTVQVRVGTGSVDVVDDVIRKPGTGNRDVKRAKQKKMKQEQQDAGNVDPPRDDTTRGVEAKESSVRIEQTVDASNGNGKKRKPAGNDDAAGDDDGGLRSSTDAADDTSRAGKKPRLGRGPGSQDETGVSSKPNLSKASGQTSSFSLPGDISLDDHPMDDDGGDDEEKEEDDDDADDNDDFDMWTKTRKTSMLEITISLIRHT